MAVNYHNETPDDLFDDTVEDDDSGLQFIDGELPGDDDVISDDGVNVSGESEDVDEPEPTDDGIDVGDPGWIGA